MDLPQHEIHTFPSDDDQFRAFVATTLKLFRPKDCDELTSLVRAAFPTAAVSERDSLASLAGYENLAVVWYVFRDGSGTPRESR